jgi:hypothetical protein
MLRFNKIHEKEWGKNVTKCGLLKETSAYFLPGVEVNFTAKGLINNIRFLFR